MRRMVFDVRTTKKTKSGSSRTAEANIVLSGKIVGQVRRVCRKDKAGGKSFSVRCNLYGIGDLNEGLQSYLKMAAYGAEKESLTLAQLQRELNTTLSTYRYHLSLKEKRAET